MKAGLGILLLFFCTLKTMHAYTNYPYVFIQDYPVHEKNSASYYGDDAIVYDDGPTSASSKTNVPVLVLNDSHTHGFILDSRDEFYKTGLTSKIKLKAEPSNYRITLRVLFLDIYKKSNGQCLHDKLVISGSKSEDVLCGRKRPNKSYSSETNYVIITFVSRNDTSRYYKGFQIAYTRFHNDECSTNEFKCWNPTENCIPAHLKCDEIDNCGDFSDERSCSSYTSIGSIFVTCTIIISMLVMTIIICTCFVRIILDNRRGAPRRSAVNPPQNAISFPTPPAESGTANPYNEPPPSYYAVFVKSNDEAIINRDNDNTGAYDANYNRAFERENEEDTIASAVVNTTDRVNNPTDILERDHDSNGNNRNTTQTSNALDKPKEDTNSTENTESFSRDGHPNSNIENTFIAPNNSYENNAFETNQPTEDVEPVRDVTKK